MYTCKLASKVKECYGHNPDQLPSSGRTTGSIHYVARGIQSDLTAVYIQLRDVSYHYSELLSALASCDSLGSRHKISSMFYW